MTSLDPEQENSKAIHFEIVPLEPAQRAWAARLLEERWGSPERFSRKGVHQAHLLPGFIAVWKSELQAAHDLAPGCPAGLLTYCLDFGECEVVTLDSLIEGQGIGTRLLEQVRQVAEQANCRRLWLITSNDNLHALRFYQRRGWRLAALHRGAIDQARQLKPSIPLIGMEGIPIHDEIELELTLPG